MFCSILDSRLPQMNDSLVWPRKLVPNFIKQNCRNSLIRSIRIVLSNIFLLNPIRETLIFLFPDQGSEDSRYRIVPNDDARASTKINQDSEILYLRSPHFRVPRFSLCLSVPRWSAEISGSPVQKRKRTESRRDTKLASMVLFHLFHSPALTVPDGSG